MSKTDQAFIDAYRRKSGKDASQPREPAPHAAEAAVHGPHVRFGGGPKAPLSQVMQSRGAADAAAPQRRIDKVGQTPAAATQIASFRWPREADQLADRHADAFAGLLDAVVSQQPELGLVGGRPGSGCTTTTLALARLLSSSGRSVALVDADPVGAPMAARLGLIRSQTLAGVLANGAAIADATLNAAEEGVSLVVAGSITQHAAIVREALDDLRSNHDVVLLDLGADPRRVMISAAAIALVHTADESDAVVEYSCRTLHGHGRRLVGVVETMAPAA